MEQELQTKTGVARIPYSEVKEMVTTFHDRAKKHPEYDEATHVKAVWFSLEDIQSMCKRLTNKGADGVRIYFGRYPADVSKYIEPKPTPKTDTVIFVSTRTTEQGVEHSDYFVDMPHPMVPENRGEQCQPHCGGVDSFLSLA